MTSEQRVKVINEMSIRAFLLLWARVERGANLNEEVDFYIEHGESAWAYRRDQP